MGIFEDQVTHRCVGGVSIDEYIVERDVLGLHEEVGPAR